MDTPLVEKDPPDFFLVTAEGTRIHVVETKMDGDSSALNAGKRAAAIDHFETLGPDDYDSLFEALRQHQLQLDDYVSGLEGALI